jgi:hypothetical protein
MSPGVAPEKDSKPPEWEAERMTRSRERNTLNPFPENDLWKMTPKKKA